MGEHFTSIDAEADEVEENITFSAMACETSYSPAFDMPLVLPPSCSDLPFSSPRPAFQAAIVYEAINRCSSMLRLSLFYFEDFCAAVNSLQESSSLLNEVFMALLRFLLRNHDCVILPSPNDYPEIWLDCLDPVTWPEICRSYVESRSDASSLVLSVVNGSGFPFVSCEQRLAVLQFLTEMLLKRVMEEFDSSCISDGNPFENAQQVNFLPKFLIGEDSRNRRYWFLSRRLFVEEGKQCRFGDGICLAYYSTIGHVQNVIGQFVGSVKTEDQELQQAFNFWLPAITRDTSITQDLTEQELAQVMLPEHGLDIALQFDSNHLKSFATRIMPVDSSHTQPKLFRMGDSGSFRRYENVFHGQHKKEGNQQQRENIVTFGLPSSNKVSCINWQTSRPEETWTPVFLAYAIRRAILSLETTIPRSNSLFMPAWLSTSLCCRWRRAVESACHSPQHFALAMLMLNANIRLVSFSPVWSEAISATTAADQRSAQSCSRIAKQSEIAQKSTVKFSKNVRHSVWKQQGEEYRLTAGGGWFWMRSDRRGRHFSNKPSDLQCAAAKFRQEHNRCSVLHYDGNDIVNVSASLQSRDLFARIPATACPTLDVLLSQRLKEVVAVIREQQSEILKIVDVLKQGRRMVDIFPPSLLPLPDNLPPCIRHLSISLETSVEQLLEMKHSLAGPPTDDPSTRLKRKKAAKHEVKSVVHRFQTRRESMPNIFVLPGHLAKWLSRRGGLCETCPGYLHQAPATWYVGTAPVPSFGTAWGFRTSQLCCSSAAPTFAAVAVQLRCLATCLRLSEMASPPLSSWSGNCLVTSTSDGETQSRELLKARVHSLERRQFEYLASVVTSAKDGPSFVTERWLPDSSLELCEIRYFHETLSRKSIGLLSQGRCVAEDHSPSRPPSTAVVKVPSPVKQKQPQPMQELRITQLQSGQVLIKGLLPEQYMLRVPDGSFQLVTLTPATPTVATSQRTDRVFASPQNAPRLDMAKLKRDLGERAGKLRQLILAKRTALEQRYCPISTPIAASTLRQTSVDSSKDLPEPVAPSASSVKLQPQSPTFATKEARQSPQMMEATQEKPIEGTDKLCPPSALGKKRQISVKEESPARATKTARRSPQRTEVPTEKSADGVVGSPSEPKKRQANEDSPARTTKPVRRSRTPKPGIDSTPVIETKAEKTAVAEVEKQEPPRQSSEPVVEAAPSTTSVDQKLYCLCKTIYDPTRFYIGCEKCGDWFHGSCVGITEEAAQSLDIYYCDACKIKLGLSILPKVESEIRIAQNANVPAIPVLTTPQKKATASDESNTVSQTTAVPFVTAPEAAVAPPSKESAAEKVVEKAEKVVTPMPDGSRSSRTRTRSLAQQTPISKDKETEIFGGKAVKEAALGAETSSAVRSKKQSVSAKSVEPQPQLAASSSAELQQKPTAEQKQGTVSVSDELYCICKTPYDDTEFYIGCDKCGDWFHGYCVFVAECEAKWIVNWNCPRCRGAGDESNVLLNKDDLWRGVEQILAELQRHKKSWPFRAPVDRALYPVYYAVIRRPIDLSLIALRVAERRYATIDQFKYDVLLMFDNCRRFNPPGSKFFHCADEVQSFFLERYRALLNGHGI